LENYNKQLDKYKVDLENYKKAAAAAKENGQKPPPEPKPPANPKNNPNRPCVLYNGMIHPLQPYAIKGAIWYQGESNASRADQYQTLFPTMIRTWRADWGEGDFPFFFVQLAPFMKIQAEPGDSTWAELREAQRLTAVTVPKT